MKIWLFLLLLSFLLVSCQSVSNLAKEKYTQSLDAWEKGQKKEAISLISEAIQASPNYYDAHVQLGNFYSQSNEHAKAAEEYETAIQLDDSDHNIYLALGDTCIALAREEESEEQAKRYLRGQYAFSRVLEFKRLPLDDKFRATLGKGVCLLYRTLTEDARRYIHEAAQLKPDHIDSIFYTAALREQEMGANKKSMQTYETVLQKKPNHLEALKWMGDLFKKIGLPGKALDYYQQFLAKGGRSTSIKEWVSEQEKATVAAGPTTAKEIVMVCRECGRIGKQGQQVCDFDGADLLAQDDPHIEK